MTTVSILQNKKPNIAKLKMAGILKKDGQYTFAIPIMNGQFQLLIVIAQTGEMTTQVIDAKSGEDIRFILQKACCPFIATVRQAYEEVLAQIEEEYFEPDIFKSREAQETYLMSVTPMAMNWNFYGNVFLIMLFGAEGIVKNGMQH